MLINLFNYSCLIKFEIFTKSYSALGRVTLVA